MSEIGGSIEHRIHL